MDGDEEVAAAFAARQRLACAFLWLAQASVHGPGPKGKKRKKGTLRWADHVCKLTEDEFKARYRLGSESFYTLLARASAASFGSGPLGLH